MVTVALSIAGSDPSGGAGIQADLKTFHQHGVYGCAVVSLLTAQNTLRVDRAVAVDPGLVADQLDRVLEDLPVAAAKTGALGSAAIVAVVAERFVARRIPLVIDPVRLATHGATLIEDGARALLLERLLPCAALITPNADEASWLTGLPVRSLQEAVRAASALRGLGARAVLIKGGHLDERDAVDVYCDQHGVHELRAERIENATGHGLGCTLSAAITARVALGQSMLQACAGAKQWLRDALAHSPQLGHGRSPVNHFVSVGDLPLPIPPRSK